MARKLSIVMPLLILVFALIPDAVSPQPPVVTNTLYVGNPSWGPARADPVRAYDTASGELLFNVYNTLISMGEPVDNAWGTPQFGAPWDVQEQYWAFSPCLATNVPTRTTATNTITSMDVLVTNPTSSTWSDGSTCVGWADNNNDGTLGLTDVMYMAESDGSYRTWTVTAFSAGPPVSVTLERYSYTFHIRTVDGLGDPINFYDNTGGSVDTFDVADAQYSFQRGLVQDQYGSPMWMFYKPFFNQMNSDWWTNATSFDLAHLINNTIEVYGSDLIMNLGISFPDIAFKQILTQTWGSIVSKEWCIGRGCWNGDLFADANANSIPDWFEPYPTGWRHVGAGNVPISAINPINYVGTGPYRVITASSALNLVVLQRNPGYWKGWPATQRKSWLETIELRYVSDWAQRKSDFIAGNLDVITVPRMNMNELLDSYHEPMYADIKVIKNLPELSVNAAFFNFNINWELDFLGTGQFPDGIPVNFFNNTHVRRAFAYGFNHSKYLNEVMLNEAICRENPLIKGLVPDYYAKGPDPPYTYDTNYDAAEAELKQAIFGATSVWDSGFYVALPYIVGRTQDMSALQILGDFFGNLSTYDGRTGPLFNIGVVSFDPNILMYWDYTMFPMFIGTWLADFSDADNFIRPFMHSDGDFAAIQKYTATNGWGTHKDELIDLALVTPDGPERAVVYAELQQVYIDDIPSFPLSQPMERRWQKYWVKGWYCNAYYPSAYYYDMYKEDACWGDVNGAGVNNWLPDGVDSMRDIGYVAAHFGARAPERARVPPYDAKWAPGVYGAMGADVYGDRKIDMRDIGFMCAHFGDTTSP